MIWNGTSTEERLHLWKALRADLKGKELNYQLAEIAKFCAYVPFGTREIDYYSPESWPTPWEIIFYGSFCKSSISLLMFQTLSLIEVNAPIELELIDDGSDIYLIPIIDDQYVLNYHLGEVAYYDDIAQEFDTKKIFTQEQIKRIL